MISQPPAPRTFETVQAGRGIAAVLVVLFHASAAIFPAPKYWDSTVFGRVFDFGYAGVDFFFVLSGFIIAHVHARDIGRPPRLMAYASRRLARIYPVYWVVLAGVLGLLYLPLGLRNGLHPDVLTIASSIVLVGPDNLQTVVDDAWTLYHEILFYVIFGIWILSPRAGTAATLIWGGVVASAALGHSIPSVPDYVASPLNLLFLLGVTTRWISYREWLPRPATWAWFGALMFVGSGSRPFISM